MRSLSTVEVYNMRVKVKNFICITLLTFLSLSTLKAQSTLGISAKSLDALLQNYAFKALMNPKTGIPYDAQVPNNLKGIKVSILRLRSGSLRTRGVQSYKEFQIPLGVLEQQYVKRLALVYHNLGNWSSNFYPLPGFNYLTPVLGLLAYDAFNLSGVNLPELDISASEEPILVKFQDLILVPNGSILYSPKCVSFGLDGSVEFEKLLPGNVCKMTQQGHLCIVSGTVAPSPESPSPNASDDNKVKSKVWKIIGPLIGVFGLLILFILIGFLIMRVKQWRNGKKMQEMIGAIDRTENLQMKYFGNTKAPLASGTRTRPMLENRYVP